MRSLLAATALLVVMGATPSLARDYPVCSRAADSDFNPSCSFDTMRQCMATVSGIGGDCIRNPGFAYGQAPQPRLHGKAARAAARAAAARENDWDNGGSDWNRRW
ncbi:MAG: hypothetical protein JWQ94_1141 [Tardiphaga sp.]|jgi:hypothetical protein|nr:hypothetical protein [Tardiphaga sp.]